MYARQIKKIAVLGAGVMGAQIAAHFANAGHQVVLFDLKKDAVKAALKGLTKSSPAALALPGFISRISAADYDNDLDYIKDCDLVLEAIVENIEWKHDLYRKVMPLLSDHAILASNTSSISLSSLADALDDDLKTRFLGLHFFNPPRYMHLLEIIPTPETDPQVISDVEYYFTRVMGKGVVLAKDKPGFVGNRIGVFALICVLHHADKMGFSPDLVDELTGTLLGRPKSATYRTADVVGLDVMKLVVDELGEHLPDDPWNAYFKLPQWIETLIQQGDIGAKVKSGVYKKIDGKICYFDKNTGEYVTSQRKLVDKSVIQALKLPLAERYMAMQQVDHPQATFLLNVWRDIIHYSVCTLADVAQTAGDLDFALRWGYGWEMGPLEEAQAMGWQSVMQSIVAGNERGNTMAQAELPAWALDAKRDAVHSGKASFSPTADADVEMFSHPVYQNHAIGELLYGQEAVEKTTLMETDNLHCWTLDHQVAIISFKTKLSAIGASLITDMNLVLDKVEKNFHGVVIWQPKPPFCAGANLYEVLMATKAGAIYKPPSVAGKLKLKASTLMANLPPVEAETGVYQVIEQLQALVMRMKHGPVPVVSAVEGLALGGGCELLLHSDRVVAHIESYIGLVEVGVGLLPAGGGTKEMTVRAVQGSEPGLAFPKLAKFYENIAKGEVAKSAYEAKAMGYLRESDRIVMHRSDVLPEAIRQVHSLHLSGYVAPTDDTIAAPGPSAKATIQALLTNFRVGEYISEHDEHIAKMIADVMAGGGVSEGELIGSDWLLKLEREAFCKLLETDKTQARIEHMLKKGKPLRN